MQHLGLYRVCVAAASAVFNSNSRIMVAALKFFLGQDEATGDDSDDDNDEEDIKAVQPTKAEMYKANSKVSLHSAPECNSMCVSHGPRQACTVKSILG